MFVIRGKYINKSIDPIIAFNQKVSSWWSRRHL